MVDFDSKQNSLRVNLCGACAGRGDVAHIPPSRLAPLPMLLYALHPPAKKVALSDAAIANQHHLEEVVVTASTCVQTVSGTPLCSADSASALRFPNWCLLVIRLAVHGG